jgi:hypothetical protein
MIEYLKHFIREEQMKNRNSDVLKGLEQTMKDYEEEMKLFKQTIENDPNRSNSEGVLQPKEIFPLVATLYRLPINGQKICEQVDGLKISQDNITAQREVFVELPAKAESTKVMRQFRNAFFPENNN